jgi:hypothetical protein
VVNGTEKRLTAADPTGPTELEKEKIINWQKKNNEARISKLITLKILSKLAGCRTAYDMWKNLSTLYLKKTQENIFTLLRQFFEYKMSPSDDISTHIQNINSMAMLLGDLDNIQGKLSHERGAGSRD